QYLTALEAVGDALVLNLMRFDQELRKPEEFELPRGSLKDYKIQAKEIDLALQLIKAMSTTWKPEEYHDDYREALMAWIESKAKQKPPKAAKKEKRVAERHDIMELLKQSVEQGAKASKTKKPRKRAAS